MLFTYSCGIFFNFSFIIVILYSCPHVEGIEHCLSLKDFNQLVFNHIECGTSTSNIN